MARIYLDGDNVQLVQLSVQQARTLCGATEECIGDDTLDNALDLAQGEVYMGKSEKQYVVIVIGP